MSTVKADNFTWKSGEAGGQPQYTVSADKVILGVSKTWGKLDLSSGSATSVRTYNISSFVKNATGDVTTNFTNALISSDYIVVEGTSNATYTDMINLFDYPNGYYQAPTTTGFRSTFYGQNAYRDIKAFMFSIFV